MKILDVKTLEETKEKCTARNTPNLLQMKETPRKFVRIYSGRVRQEKRVLRTHHVEN
jgi:hypothetical protein